MDISLQEALKQWKNEHTSDDIGKVTEVYLQIKYGRPPIKKLDNSLETMKSVEMLSLSSNCIEKISGFQNLQHLRVLSLARNNLHDLTGLECLSETLEQLWVSYNLIEKVKALTSLRKLRVLYIAHNLIKDWSEVERLEELPDLVDVLFLGNPIAEMLEDDKYRAEVSKRLPKVKTIDGETVV